jgi:hypothetical protein
VLAGLYLGLLAEFFLALPLGLEIALKAIAHNSR